MEQYIKGKNSKVRMVPKPRPNIMTTAILAKKSSVTKGNIPKIVVIAPIDTGRTRLTALSYTA